MKGLQRNSVWIGLTVSLYFCAPAMHISAAPEAPRAARDGIKLSFAKYSKISERRLETMRLTRDGKFDAVEAVLAPLQAAFERKEVDEFAVATAFAPFSTSDESLAPVLDRWVAQVPNSYCAHLARARYLRQRFYRFRTVESMHSEMAIGADRLREIAERSIADYRAALAKSPRLMIAYGDLVEMAAATRNDALFRETVETGLKALPETWVVRDAMVRVGAIPEAQFEAFLADAARYEKQNPLLLQLASDVALEAGREMWRKGQIEPALALYEAQAKTLDTFQIHKERARLLRVLRRYPEASAAIDHAIALLPGKYDGYRERGWLDVDTERWPEAVADFRRGLALDPLEPELNRGLGAALEGAGDPIGALAAYEQSARWLPSAEVFQKIGWLQLHEAKNAKASLAAMERAVALDPRDKWNWYKQAEALDALGDPRATASFAHYLELADPRSEEDREYIAYAKQRTRSGAAPSAPSAKRGESLPASKYIPPPPAVAQH